LSLSVGWSGLVGGQALDLSSGENGACIEDIHDGKTGVLFEAATLGGAASAGALDRMGPAFRDYACFLGRAYQAFDDILDQVADDQLAGKSTSRDDGKLTAITETGGMNEALAEAKAQLEAAKDALPYPDQPDTPLRLFTDHIFDHFSKAFEKSGLSNT
ncbi:MAG: polyprenyl synthetase family protein, partial [Pseudomonadota bacterium]